MNTTYNLASSFCVPYLFQAVVKEHLSFRVTQ